LIRNKNSSLYVLFQQNLITISSHITLKTIGKIKANFILPQNTLLCKSFCY